MVILFAHIAGRYFTRAKGDRIRGLNVSSILWDEHSHENRNTSRNLKICADQSSRGWLLWDSDG